MNRRLLLLSLCLCCIPLWTGNSLHAQQNHWELSATGGIMTPNNFNMLEFTAATFGGEVAWWHRCEGDQWWVWRRRNPSFGVRASFAYIPQGVAGHRVGLVGLVSSPLWKRWDYHIGLGLSGFSRSQYFTHDRKNIFISTLVSCLIDVGLDYRLADRCSLSLAFLHSSNGMLHRPNKGLNFIQLGMTYAVGPNQVSRLQGTNTVPPIQPERQKSELGFALQGGVVMSRDLNQNGYFPCYDVSLNYQYYLDPAVAVGGTLDFWYNGSHYGLARMYDEPYRFPCYLSALVYTEGFWGPLSVKAGIGPVLLAPPRVDVRIYERVGAYYNFGNHYTGVALNAHAGMIEFIELAYGYRIPI